jgi:hypothetical protein
VAAEAFVNLFSEIIDESGCLPEQVFNAKWDRFILKKDAWLYLIAKEEKSVPHMVAKDHLTLLLGGGGGMQ